MDLLIDLAKKILSSYYVTCTMDIIKNKTDVVLDITEHTDLWRHD